MCADQGLKTLILERKKLPREKVCSGLLSGKTVASLIREIFGEFPEGILCDPFYIQGAIVYLEGVEPEIIEERMPTALRKDLDYWMTQKASEKGAEVQDSTVVVGMSENRGSYTLEVEKEGRRNQIESKFVIGADGAFSRVRKVLFPGLKVRYQQAIREYFRGSLPSLSRQYIHVFPDPARGYVFLINHKGDSFALEVSGKTGETKRLRETVAKPFLTARYGFDHDWQPLWRDGCLEARLERELVSGSFLPARGNALLVGDAGGFQLPTAEGIGTALRSASLAAAAITKAIRQGTGAAESYLKEIGGIVEAIKTFSAKGRYNPADGPEAAAKAIRQKLSSALELRY